MDHAARSARHPYLDWPGPIAFAHRGGASDAPENTMPAFEHAVELGFRYLETDVRVTADGVVVAFHDDDLSRTCGRQGRISELPWAEVATARVDGEEPIPRLGDLFEAFPDARLNIDCKSDTAVASLADEIERHGVLDRVCLASFSDSRVRALRRRLGAGLCTGAATRELAVLWAAGRNIGGFHAAQVPVRQRGLKVVTRRFIELAHRRRVAVHVWTIDDAAEMHRLLDMGVDGIMTDRPTILRDVFVERGAWL
jgi:glycerophosphoryl diester phosphodiesterase